MLKIKPLLLLVFLASSCVTLSDNYPDKEERTEQKSLESSIGVLKKVPQALNEVPPARYAYPGLSDREAKRSIKIPVYNWSKALFTDAQYVRVKHDYFLEFNK